LDERDERVRMSFHVLDPAWREEVDCHVGQSGEIVRWLT
jgi:hypothetical protein